VEALVAGGGGSVARQSWLDEREAAGKFAFGGVHDVANNNYGHTNYRTCELDAQLVKTFFSLKRKVWHSLPPFVTVIVVFRGTRHAGRVP